VGEGFLRHLKGEVMLGETAGLSTQVLKNLSQGLLKTYFRTRTPEA